MRAEKARRPADAASPGADAAPAPPWPLAERPGFLARRLHQVHVGLFMERCAAFQITPLQYSVLCVLADLGAADQTSLAAAIALDRTTTTGILKRLEARGLVRRLKSEADRRARDCGLTPEGAAVLARMETAARAAHKATLEPLSPDERALLVALIARVVAVHARDTPAPLLG